MERALQEFVAAARRLGVQASTAELLDAARAAALVGVGQRADLRLAFAATLAKSEPERGLLLDTFERFFGAEGSTRADLYERLAARGFNASELQSLRAELEARISASPAGPLLRALTQGPAELEQLLANAARAVRIARHVDPGQTGFLSMRVLERARFARAENDVLGVRAALRGALGARGEELADALAVELGALRPLARRQVELRSGKAALRLPLEERPFAELEPHERVALERAVQQLVQRILGRAAVRRRRRARGRIDLRRTLRRALRTAGVPMELRRQRRPRARPKLLVLCDVSDSMQASLRFLLLFVHAVQRLFSDAHSLVFVSDVADASAVFRAEPPERAIELAYRGAIVSVADNSNYGRVFEQLLREQRSLFDAQTTWLVLGDGRSHHFPPGLAAFAELAGRVRRTLWFTPEPEGAWSAGDSHLQRYLPHLDQVFSVHDLAGLRRAARALVRA